MVPLRKLLIFLWRCLDPVYFHCTRLTYIQRGKNIFRVRLTHYKGHPVILTDGTTITKNDLLIKIHFHNVYLLPKLMAVTNEFQKGRRFYQSVKHSLPGLARFLEAHPEKKRIKGLIGITALHLRTNSLGFETFEIKNPLYKKWKALSLLPIQYLSTGRLRSRKNAPGPVYFFMSKRVLIERYGSGQKLEDVMFGNRVSV